MTARLASAMPVLPSLDFEATERAYAAFGFATLHRDEGTLILARDGARLMFWVCEDRSICEASGAYLAVEEVDALAREAEAAGWRTVAAADKPWGQREAYLFDPHGNLLRLGQPLR